MREKNKKTRYEMAIQISSQEKSYDRVQSAIALMTQRKCLIQIIRGENVRWAETNDRPVISTFVYTIKLSAGSEWCEYNAQIK